MDINQDFREFVELLNNQKAKYLIVVYDLRINKLKTGRDQDIIDLKNLPEE
jgi:hypothetical protein